MCTDKDRLKIAFLTSMDPRDKRSWSGTIYYMAKALQKYCGDLHYLGPVALKREYFLKKVDSLTRRLLRKRYDYAHSPLLARKYAKIFTGKLEGESCDLIFAPIAATEVAYLNAEIPLVYMSDITFSLINDFYVQYRNLIGSSIRRGHKLEGCAIAQADLLIYPSQWAATSAVEDYNADVNRIDIIPFGANLDDIPPKEVVLKKKKPHPCKLLFIGVDWHRKGGDIAYRTMLKMKELGVDTELVVCGCMPPEGLSHPNMRVIPFLDKNDVRQHQELLRLFMDSAFLILPTKGEASPIVLCEAAALGLPVVAAKIGGVPEIVQDGENGHTLPPSAGGDDYAEVIYRNYCNDEQYYQLVFGSRKAYDHRLNWDAWGREMYCSIRNLIT